MEFKNMAIGEHSFGDDSDPDLLNEMEKVDHVDFTDANFFQLFKN